MSLQLNKFYVLDFDRCLGRIDGLAALLYRSAELSGIDATRLAEARAQVEASAGSFDALEWIKTNYAPDAFEAVMKKYHELEPKEPLLEPGAADFLRRLKEGGVPFGIMTYGGEAWQRAKLARAGLSDVPAVITASTKKGIEIAGWETGEHDFRLPKEIAGYDESVFAKEIVLIDDKASAFSGLPRDGAAGYLIMHSEQVMPSQSGDIPENVVRVRSFEEIAEREGLPSLPASITG